MTQTLQGRVIRNDNIAAGQACGTENAVAVAVPGPSYTLEDISVAGGVAPVGIEMNAAGVLGPNPEIP
jgi:hypothetical protein